MSQRIVFCRIALGLILAVLPIAVHAEAPSPVYRDGRFAVETKPDYEGYFTRLVLEIKQGRIALVEWKIWDKNRNRPFDATYEEVFPNREYKEQCRKDLAGAKGYAPRLVETQDLERVDAVTGATWTQGKFKEAVRQALASDPVKPE